MVELSARLSKNMLDLLFAYVQTKLTLTKIKMTLVQ